MTSTKNEPQGRPLHRGAPTDMALFAKKFLSGRLGGFEKDIRICLTGTKTNDGYVTHAYFPALGTCCGMLEYLAGLYVGRIDGLGRNEIINYSKYLPQPDYNADAIRVLFEAFRNAVAHRGIASGVWIDQQPATQGRRLTWSVHADSASPALALVSAPGVIKRDSPWPCSYTHRFHIHLGRLWRDIRDSVNGYLGELVTSKALQSNFQNCMKQLYPVQSTR
jgi:hypothetical protein